MSFSIELVFRDERDDTTKGGENIKFNDFVG